MSVDVEKKFCASPWVEGVFRLNGAFQPCCKTRYPYGNWQREGLKIPWHSDAAVEFRRSIADGVFPNTDCKSCHNNGQSTNLNGLLAGPLNAFLTSIHRINPRRVNDLQKLKLILVADNKDLDEDSAATLQGVFRTLAELTAASDIHSADYKGLLNHVRTIAEIAEDYLTGQAKPRHVAPFRQANVIAICNARCIHCPGLYSKEISEGARFKIQDHKAEELQTQVVKEMSREDVEKTLQSPSSIVDFFANGSELLFLKQWKHIADRLRKNHIKLRVSTNGMLLTRSNVEHLVDNDIVRKMNISLDAASPALLEKIRVRVKYDRVCGNIRHLVHYCEKKEYDLALSFSICLMRMNYHELPEFVDFVRSLIGSSTRVRANIMVQALTLKGKEEYGRFVHTQHHSLIDRKKLINSFTEMRKRSLEAEVPVQVFYRYHLEEFINLNFPFPKLEWSDVSMENFVPGPQPKTTAVSPNAVYISEA